MFLLSVRVKRNWRSVFQTQDKRLKLTIENGYICKVNMEIEFIEIVEQ